MVADSSPSASRRYFVVTRVRGDAWDHALGLREQDAWDAHARFMDALVDDGFVVLGGPLGDGTRTLLIVDAVNERQIEARLSEDPWVSMRLLRLETIEPWQVLLAPEP
ncbi:MAG: hypothetical protein ACJ74L_12940 [Gaiellaceae bacterium]